MKIQKIIEQTRRDFRAVFECESCGHTEQRDGYDDRYFHEIVIPDMQCTSCGKKAPTNYKPLSPKYSEYDVV